MTVNVKETAKRAPIFNSIPEIGIAVEFDL